MEITDYQERARLTAVYVQQCEKKGVPTWCYSALGLGEVGEIQGKIKKIIRDNNDLELTGEQRAEIKKEIGDALWYLANLATDIGASLNVIALENLAKLADRKNRGVIGGSGDNR